MAKSGSFSVNPGWRILFEDLGLSAASILKRAGLPNDLWGRTSASLSMDEYFRLWRGIQEESGDPVLPLRIGTSYSVESFDAPLFAALCSSDLNAALTRLAIFKRLITPQVLHVEIGPTATTLELEWLDATTEPPASMITAELVFFVRLARLATRTELRPLEVLSPYPLASPEEYTAYFGVEVKSGSRPLVSFRSSDAQRPFLTANEAMWKTFEPELRRRLSDLDESATIYDRVRAALLELLPSGTSSMETVARRLGISVRTMQRRLSQEHSTYQSVLNGTREELARHYLKTSDMSGAEISYLLGFEDANSFFRAFRAWTGETPENVRGVLQGSS
jgi:AraC-like DNA-binding protein